MTEKDKPENNKLGRIKLGAVPEQPKAEDSFAKVWTKSDLKNKEIEVPDVVKEKLLSNEAGTAGTKQYQENAGINLYGALDCAEPPYNMASLSKLYDANPFHAAAVDAKTDSVVGLGYLFEYSRDTEKLIEEVERKDADGKKKRKLELKLNDQRAVLEKLIDSMNQEDEMDEILVKLFKDRCSMGNAYIEVGRNAEGEVAYIGHVSARNIRIRTKRDGFIQTVNNKNIFFRNFGDTTTPDPTGVEANPNELIHYKTYSPIDDYYGVPEITSALQAVASLEFAQRYNIDYFENKAVPRYIIKTKGMNMTASQQTELLKFFETAIKGVSHRTILLPVPGGADKDIDFVPVETGRQDGSFGESMKLNIQFILSRHRVPQARIGMSAAATSAAESRESEKTFKETVCRPEQRLIEKKLNKVIRELTDMFVFKLKEYTLTDEDQQSQIQERYLRWGVLTPDEIRTGLGLGPRPDGKGGEPVDVRSISELTAKDDAAQTLANEKATTYRTRKRDQDRSSDRPDQVGNANGRRSAGQGRHPNK